MEPTAVSLPWSEVAKLALGAGVVATLVAQTFDWLKERSRSKRLAAEHATYLAARVAVILEDFAIRCAQAIADNNMYEQSGGDAGSPQTTLAKMGDYPSEGDWTTLDSSLLARCLSIPNELAISEQSIAAWWEVGVDPDSVQSACDSQSGKCGYRAWRLADE